MPREQAQWCWLARHDTRRSWRAEGADELTEAGVVVTSRIRASRSPYAIPRDLAEGRGFGARPRQATQANDCTTPSSINAPGRSVPKRPARRDRLQCPTNAAVRAAAIPTTTCGMGDLPCRRASSPALAPPKTIRPARPGGSSRFGALGLLSSTSSPTASKPRRTLATGFPRGRSSRVLERLTAAIPEKERPPVAAPIASDRPTVRARDVLTTAILPDDAGWCRIDPPKHLVAGVGVPQVAGPAGVHPKASDIAS
jgi:hypothetical protein